MMPRTLRLAGLTVLAGCLALGWASAGQGDKQGEKGEPKAKSSADFVLFASETDLAEITLGKLAKKRGSAAVKSFGTKMVTDHGKASKKLQKIATKNRWKMATQLSKEHRALAAKLGKLKGKEFDRTYVAAMVKGHRKVADAFQAQADNGKNAQLKAFAAEILPVIREHLRMAEDLQGQPPGGGGKDKSDDKK